MNLIYCAGGHRRLMQIAADAGWAIGIRSDKAAYDFPIRFVDLHYKAANWAKHLTTVYQHRPQFAIVPDLSDREVLHADVARAMRQHDQLARYCEIPLIVPKMPGQIAMLPAHVAIAYSIPTSYGGARFGLHEMAGRRVHLLGGNPRQQQEIARWIPAYGAEVISADGNMSQKASQLASYWDRGWHDHSRKNRKGTAEPDLMYECFEMSLRNILAEWQMKEVAA
jgi:hypothetical protein